MRNRQSILNVYLTSLALTLTVAGAGLESGAAPAISGEKLAAHAGACSCRRPLSDDNAAAPNGQREIALNAQPQSTASAQTDGQSANTFLEDLDLYYVSQGKGECRKDKTVDGSALKMNGQTYGHGISTHSPSELTVDLKGQATKFEALVGVDDEVGKRGSVTFEVWTDGKKVYDSGLLHGGDAPAKVSIDLTCAKSLLLIVADGGDSMDGDHADWADAQIVMASSTSDRPVATTVPDEPPPIMAPADNTTAAFHGPTVVGTTPGRPFSYLLAATGTGKMTFEATDLPAGLNLDAKTGMISGVVAHEGQYLVHLKLEAGNGTAHGKLLINAGTGKLNLTPQMGWNSWNCWGGRVDSKKIRDAADWLVKSGLAAHGYQYINIDDGWEGGRDSKGTILTNERFGDMKALVDYVHSKGLKIGLYSGPGPMTCQRLEGSYKHEAEDAKSWADWGFDYVKYDLCSYNDMLIEKFKNNVPQDEYIKPYELMGKCLNNQNRDIVYSLCQYGLGTVWQWGARIGGNSWRTTNDIVDHWGSMSNIGFSQGAIAEYAGPGHWTDPDMLVIGKVGIRTKGRLHSTLLNHNEQVTHITLWSMLAAPLLIGCDLSQLDSFTTDLMSNDDVIAVSQDPLGKQATCLEKKGLLEVYSKKLADGTVAVGLFNRSPHLAKVAVDFSKLGLSGAQNVRDLWQRKDLGKVKGSFAREVAPHGTILIKVGNPKLAAR